LLTERKGLHKNGKLNPKIEKDLMAISSYKKWWDGEKPTKPEPYDTDEMLKIISDYDKETGKLIPSKYIDIKGLRIGGWLLNHIIQMKC